MLVVGARLLAVPGTPFTGETVHGPGLFVVDNVAPMLAPGYGSAARITRRLALAAIGSAVGLEFDPLSHSSGNRLPHAVNSRE